MTQNIYEPPNTPEKPTPSPNQWKTVRNVSLGTFVSSLLGAYLCMWLLPDMDKEEVTVSSLRNYLTAAITLGCVISISGLISLISTIRVAFLKKDHP